jgi:hypothetical protein
MSQTLLEPERSQSPTQNTFPDANSRARQEEHAAVVRRK